jgi:Tol biopolymer transport system component
MSSSSRSRAVLVLVVLTILAFTPPTAASGSARDADAAPGVMAAGSGPGIHGVLIFSTPRRIYRVIGASPPEVLLDRASGPVLDGTGRRLLFGRASRHHGVLRPELWVAAADGSHQRRLFPGLSGNELSRWRWAPDGHHVLFSQGTIEGKRYRLSVWRIDADGGHLRELVRSVAVVLDTGWTLSPDGTRIAYVGGRHGRSLRVVDLETGQERRLVDGRGEVTRPRSPAWSPDGKVIAFAARAGMGSALYLVRPDGSSLRRVSPIVRRRVVAPTWAPGGGRIAFTTWTYPQVRVEDVPVAIWVVGRLGRSARRVRDRSEVFGAWSQDGRWFAVLGGWLPESGGLASGIWIMPAEGGSPRQVTTQFAVAVTWR